MFEESYYKPCSECKGEGSIYHSAYGRVGCDYCKGMGGFVIPLGKKLCTECRGRGKVEKLSYTEWGSLRLLDNCETCNGTGFIDKNEHDTNNTSFV